MKFLFVIPVIFLFIVGVQTCQRMAQEDTVYVESFFRGEKDITTEAQLANTFSYLMTGALNCSNAPEIKVSDINQDALRQILKPEFWERQSSK